MIHDFIIYGTGLSSKILSIALFKQGFKVLVIRDKNEDFNKSNLVTFMSQGTLNYLSQILDTNNLFAESENINQIYCEHLHNKKKSKLEFKDNNQKPLGKIVYNEIINNVLNLELIRGSKLITTIYDTEKIPVQNEDHIEFIDQNRTMHSGKLLFYSAANKNNVITNNFEFVSKNLNQEALSLSINAERLKGNTAYQIFTKDGPIALLPLNEKEASAVWSLTKDSHYLNLKKDDLELVLSKLFVNHVNNLKISKIEKFNLNFSYSKELYFKNCILIGNIAHNIHPIAGQGLNLSVRDISNLVYHLNKYRALGYDLRCNQIKDSFSNSRKFENFAFSFGTLAMENIFSNKNQILSKLTNIGFKVLNKNKYLKNYFTHKATGE